MSTAYSPLTRLVILASLICSLHASPLTSDVYISTANNETVSLDSLNSTDVLSRTLTAEQILGLGFLQAAQDERNASTQHSVMIDCSSDPPDTGSVPGDVEAVETGQDSGSSSSSGTSSAPISEATAGGISSGRLPAAQQIATGTVPTSRRRRSRKAKRNVDSLITVNSVTWPITTDSNSTLTPIFNTSARDVKKLAEKSMLWASNRWKFSPELRSQPTGYYEISEGGLSLVLQAVGEGMTGMNWRHFYYFAKQVLDLTDEMDNKSYVGNIASQDNSTVYAYWAVSWYWDQIWYKAAGKTFEHVFWGNETVDDNNNNDKKRRSLSIEAGERPESGLHGAATSLQVRTLLARPIDSNPPHFLIPMAQTGFKLAIRYGSQLMNQIAMYEVLDAGTTGTFFDANKGFIGKPDPGDKGFYLEGHYMPNFLKQFIDDGVYFLMVNGWAVAPVAMQLFFRTLRDFAKQQKFQQPWMSATFHTYLGEIIDPQGAIIGFFSIGQQLTQQMFLPIQNPDGAITMGRVLRTHDEF